MKTMQDTIEIEDEKGQYGKRLAYTDRPDPCGLVVREIHHPKRNPVFYAGRMEMRPFLEPIYSPHQEGKVSVVTHHVEREDTPCFKAYGTGDTREKALLNASNALLLLDIRK